VNESGWRPRPLVTFVRRWSATFEKCEAEAQAASRCLLGDDDEDNDDDGAGENVQPSCSAAEDSWDDEDDSDRHGDDDDEVFERGWRASAKKRMIDTSAAPNSVLT